METSLVRKHGFLLEVRTRGKGKGELHRYQWNEDDREVERSKCYFVGGDEGVPMLVRDYLELLDVHETEAGYIHGVYKISEDGWKSLKKYRKLAKMGSFAELGSIEDGEKRIEKVQNFLENLRRAERDPFLNLKFLPRLSHKVKSPKRIVRETVLDALANNTSVRAQLVPRTLGGDGDFKKTTEKAREKIRELIEIAENLLDLIRPGILRDESPEAQINLEKFSS